MTTTPFRERDYCTRIEACDYSTLSLRTITYAIKDSRIETIKIGSRRLIKVPSFLKLLGEE
ncbi:hypothetical protein [Methylobacterium nigriterrae]|uniref:hypothetical protein n=1 Tax=Methylobacterium nigriterrae TaxID=3127512 RepID=UPI003013AAD3